MPRYQSISDFRHGCSIQGRKILVNPGDVIDSPTPLNYIFLQEVDSKTPVTLNTSSASSTSSLRSLQSKLNTLEKEKDQLASTKAAEMASNLDEVNTALSKLQSQMNDLRKDMETSIEDLTNQVNSHFEDLEKQDLLNKKADEEFKKTTERRLGILKDAVRTIEDEIFGSLEAVSPPKNS